VPVSRESTVPDARTAAPSRLRTTTRTPVGLAGLAALLAVATAQSATAAVLPATSRTLGLADWQAGVVTSASAAVVVLTSAAWGRRADLRGPRRVIVAGGLAGVLGTLGVAAVLAVATTAPQTPAWVALLVARGLVFGIAVAAVGPAVQALLVAGAGERERVAWIARGGAARGLGTMVGAGLAAALAAVADALPVLVAAAVLAAAVGGVAVLAPRGGAWYGSPDAPVADAAAPDPAAPDPAAPDPAAPDTAVPAAPRARATVLLPGVGAAVVASAGAFLAMALVQGSVGFLVQDRYGLAAGRATAVTGALLLVAGLGSVLAQGVLVPRLGWAPWRLVHTGAAVVVVAVALYALPVAVPVLLAIALVFGAGVGAAAAGCTSAAASAVGPEAQGDVAGVVNAVNAFTFVIGPALSTAAYGLDPALPAAGALVAGLVALFARPRARRAGGGTPGERREGRP
jgi:MFS family permease